MILKETTAVSTQLEAQLLQVWENSVRATHDFLSDAEIKNIKQYVPQALHGVEHLIVAYVDETPVGFMGINGQMLEMLFVDASQRGQGIGKALINDGLKHYQIKRLAVNEQNPQARGFYEYMGFKVVERSAVDDQGNPYPILYMEKDNDNK